MAIAVAHARDADGDAALRRRRRRDRHARRPRARSRRSTPAACRWRSRDDEARRGARRRRARAGNLIATTDPSAHTAGLGDRRRRARRPRRPTTARRRPTSASCGPRSRTLGRHMPPGSLVIVETTVPPGTTEKRRRAGARPRAGRPRPARGRAPARALLRARHAGRGVPRLDRQLLALLRGHDAGGRGRLRALPVARSSTSTPIPLTRLHSTTASETAKVLENSYRATTIALMEEWGRLRRDDRRRPVRGHRRDPPPADALQHAPARASASAATA